MSMPATDAMSDSMPPSMMMMMMMPMYFTFGYENTFLFAKFTSSSAKSYYPWLAGIFLMCVLVQFLSYLRTNMQNKAVRDLVKRKLVLEETLL
jgi:hypothetical protein